MSFHIQYLFYDGIGFGLPDSKANPFTRYASSYLSALGGKKPQQVLLNDWLVIPTSAQLDIPGPPPICDRSNCFVDGYQCRQTYGASYDRFSRTYPDTYHP